MIGEGECASTGVTTVPAPALLVPETCMPRLRRCDRFEPNLSRPGFCPAAGLHAASVHVTHVERAADTATEIAALADILFAAIAVLVVVALRGPFLVPGPGRASSEQ